MIVPPGALASPTEITIESRRLDEFEDTDDIVNGVYDFGPDGLEFSVPVTLALPTNGLGVAAFAGAELVFWDGEGRQATPDGIAEVTESHVLGRVTHFTPYGVRIPAGLPSADAEGGEPGHGTGEGEGEPQEGEGEPQEGEGEVHGNEVMGQCEESCMGAFPDAICCKDCGCNGSGSCTPYCGGPGSRYRWDCEVQSCFDYEEQECDPSSPTGRDQPR